MVTMTITIDDKGAINVNGPIDNIMVAFGILEVAKDVIREYHQRQKKAIQPASDAEISALTHQHFTTKKG